MRISIFSGQGTELVPGLVSAIHKQATSIPLWCGANGLAGDEQCDQRHHGGPDRALHYYPADHYPGGTTGRRRWACRPRVHPGNRCLRREPLRGRADRGAGLHRRCLSTRRGADPDKSAQIPCFKLNQRFGYGQMSQVMQLSSRCGWLLRVLEEGW